MILIPWGGGALIAIVLAIALPLSLSSKNNNLNSNQVIPTISIQEKAKTFNAKNIQEKITSYNSVITKNIQDNILNYWFKGASIFSPFYFFVIDNWMNSSYSQDLISNIVTNSAGDFSNNYKSINVDYNNFLKISNSELNSFGVNAIVANYSILSIGKNNVYNLNLKFDNNKPYLEINISKQSNTFSMIVKNTKITYTLSRKTNFILNDSYFGSSFDEIVKNLLI